MDYSSYPSDPEHPAESSPWGSASPNAAKGSFPSAAAGAVPESPSRAGQQSPYGPETNYNRMQNDPVEQESPTKNREDRRPRSLSDSSFTDERDHSPDLSERLQSAQLGDPDYHIHPSQQQHVTYAAQQRAHAQAVQQGQQGMPGRYHPGARMGARQNIPQYKLQAKITGLERTGRKDPILRFDVHVRCALCKLWTRLIRADESTAISNHAISRCPPYACRIHQTRRPSHFSES